MNSYLISVNDLIHNIDVIKEKAGQTQVIGVIKGNGYGFGMKYMASLLKSEGITTFAVTEVSDAVALRQDALLEEDILLLRSTQLLEEAKTIVAHNLTATVGSIESIAILEQAAIALGKRAKAHIKIDTGMSRYGFIPTQTNAVISACNATSETDFTGIYTHFSSAFTNESVTQKQLATFKSTALQLETAGIHATLLHCANTPALFNTKGINDGMTAMRIGSGFTGRVVTKTPTKLKRVGLLKSQVIEIKKITKGAAVGYNGTFVSKKDMQLAIIPVGHFDGFGIEKAQDTNNFRTMIHTILSEIKRFVMKKKLWVKIDDKRYPVIGAIGLSHTAIDITNSVVQVGDNAYFDFSPLLVNPLLEREYL